MASIQPRQSLYYRRRLTGAEGVLYPVSELAEDDGGDVGGGLGHEVDPHPFGAD